jgi:Flp pilus assembly protein TadG
MPIASARQGRGPLRVRANAGACASAAVEFALAAPIVIVIAAGIVDFGLLELDHAALQGAARIGAQYARLHPADAAGIQRAVEASTELNPPLSIAASSALTCECADGTPIDCRRACAAAGLPGPNRVFIAVSASQTFTPLLPWPGIPATLTATAELRIQ